LKRWLGLLAVLAVATGVVLGCFRWHALLPEQRFMRVRDGMTIQEVRDIMGRLEDYPDTEEARAAEPKQQDRMWVYEQRFYKMYFDHHGLVDGKSIVRGPKS
jgi:hypothetical protein